MTTPRQAPLSGSYEDLYERGMFYFEQEQFDEALPVFERLYARLNKLSEKSFSRRPDLKELQQISTEALAAILGRQKEFERANDLIQELIQMTAPQLPEARWLQASLFYKIEQGEDFQAVLDELRAMAVMYPDNRWVWMTIGRMLSQAGDHAEAESNLKRAIEREGSMIDYMIAQTALFALYKQQQRFDEAEKTMKALWRKLDDPDAQRPYPLYWMYLQAGNLNRAEYWLEKEKNPIRTNFHRGLLAQKRGDAVEASDFWEKAVAEDLALFDEGYSDWAEAALRLEKDPKYIAQSLEPVTDDYDEVATKTLLMLSIAHIRAENLEAAHKVLTELNNEEVDTSLLKSPALNAEDWQIFTELISDGETQEAFKQYFEDE